MSVQVADLGKSYQPKGKTLVHALGGIDLEIPAGEVHGLLGPNGAGKTTLCKILSTVLLPTTGSALVCGHDVVAETATVRPLIGIVLGGERGLYSRLTARQNLRFWAALYRQPHRRAQARIGELLERLGLADRADDRVETFSRGMKQRLHLARGLIGDPRVLVLDEPTTGMDPVAAREFRTLVGELRSRELTVLITTHDMAEAESVCDRVTLIDHGHVIGTAEPRTIGNWITEFEYVQAVNVPEGLVAQIEALSGTGRVTHPDPDTIRVETCAEGASVEVLRLLLDAGVRRVSTAPPSLEEVYLQVMGGRGLAVD